MVILLIYSAKFIIYVDSSVTWESQYLKDSQPVFSKHGVGYFVFVDKNDFYPLSLGVLIC